MEPGSAAGGLFAMHHLGAIITWHPSYNAYAALSVLTAGSWCGGSDYLMFANSDDVNTPTVATFKLLT